MYIMRAFWFLLLLFAFIGSYKLLIHMTGSDFILVSFLLMTIVFFIIMTLPIAASIDARMRMPFEPLYFIFSAEGALLMYKAVVDKFNNYF